MASSARPATHWLSLRRKTTGCIFAALSTHPRWGFRWGGTRNAEHLDFADATFDLVMAITLFSSISERTMARRVAGEAARVLKTGGGLLWYDFRYDNPRNPNVHGVDRTEMRSLFPGFHGRLEAIS